MSTRSSSLSSTSTLEMGVQSSSKPTSASSTPLEKPCPLGESTSKPTSSSPNSPTTSLSLSALPELLAEAKPPYPGSGTPSDPYLVDWLPDEPANPYNWSSARRWLYTLIAAFSCLCIAFASTSYSAAVEDIVQAYPGTTQETAIAGISLYVLGFGIGPLIWAPLSEMYGRNVAFNASYPFFVIFNMAGALAKNIPSILVFRLLAGSFGSAPLTNAGGQIGDMWAAHERALATSIFSLAPFLGPVVGPIVGGFIAENCSYHIVFWVQFAFGAVMLLIAVLLVPETYAPTLLRRKAKRLQKDADERGTGEVFISKFDRVKKTKVEILKIGMSRPFAMLSSELIVFCLGLYAAIIYGTLYLFFTAFPIVFRQNRGWSNGTSGLAFLGIGVGLLIGNALQPLGNIWYNKAVRAAGPGGKAPPEARLPLCCLGAVLLPIGLFVFAWTSTPNVHWIVPIIASAPFGTGFLLIFTGMQNYLIDSYTLFAASSLAANAVCRSLFGTVFPLFSTYLYNNLGLHYAGTLVACLSLACTPMPFLFYRYGPYLRRNSKYAPSAPQQPAPGQKAVEPGTEEAEKVTERVDEALEPEWAENAGEDRGRTRERASEGEMV